MSTRLAIVGASVRAAAQSALRAGFEVAGADLFADADLDGVCPITKIEDYPYGFADWLAKQDVDAWMYTGALENYPDLVDHMATIKPLWGVSGEALRRCRDPMVLQEAFTAAGISFPKTLPLNTSPKDKTDWLAKTYRHAAGVGVWHYGDHPRDAAAYAQQFIDGTPMSAVFAVSAERTAFLGVAEQLTPESQKQTCCFGYLGSFGSIDLKEGQRDIIRTIGDVLGASLQLRGLVGVDLLFTADDIWVVEINPRYTASVELLECSAVPRGIKIDRHDAIDREAIACHATSYNGGNVDDWSFGSWEAGYGSFLGKHVVFAKQNVTMTQSWCRWAYERQATKCFWTGEPRKWGYLADLPHAGEKILAGQPVCTVLAWTYSPLPMRRLLRFRAARVERMLYAVTA
jgi:predicted ATP-grasp superfamily ATP-dependent carboligase